MSQHPVISHLAKEERIRAIAYSLWEEEGHPEGRAGDHWLRASELVAAEAEPVVETLDPDWLRREPVLVDEAPQLEEKSQTLEQLARRIAGVRAA